ncbi:MAG: hypothetical protein SVW02_00870, partial [Candidatus Nanohaloarchaea archaeon]|nr:hypothetical protein [Candidatus Nanohaloarchaea archaeon]
LEWLHENGYTHFEKVSSVISEYYKDKDTVMQMVSDETSIGFEQVVERSQSQMPPEIEQERSELEEAVGSGPGGIGGEEPGQLPGEAGGTPSPGADEPAEPGEAPGEAVDYDALVDAPVHTVRQRVEEEDLDLEAALQAERAGQDREELTRWLRGKIERRDLADTSGGEEESDEEQEATGGEHLFGDVEDEERLAENPFES